MTRIIMDSGKEYTVKNSVEEIIKLCYFINPVLNYKQPSNEFVTILEGVVINTVHISSIEETK